MSVKQRGRAMSVHAKLKLRVTRLDNAYIESEEVCAEAVKALARAEYKRSLLKGKLFRAIDDLNDYEQKHNIKP